MHLLDANAFMEANRLYYAFDLAPGFWTWLGGSNLSGKVGSIDAVKDEITAGTGDLVTWAEELPASFWVADTDDVVAAMAQQATWANAPARNYRQQAVDEFMASADLKLIAHGMVSGAIVVTREQPAPGSEKKIKIPDVCNEFEVGWTDPFSAYRALGLRLVA